MAEDRPRRGTGPTISSDLSSRRREGSVDVQVQLAEIRRLVERAKAMPMSASAVVNRPELLAALDELRDGLETAFREAQAVLADRAAEVAAGREEAARIVARAQDEREQIVSDTEVFAVAKRRADDVLARAEREAEALRKEADDYVDAKLANFEITLERTTEAVKRGRERLADRNPFDTFDGDGVDAIKLPEHLER